MNAQAKIGSEVSVHTQALKRLSHMGLATVAIFLGTLLLWSSFSTLSGAVIAPGQFVVNSNVKKVQHPTGGIVAELLVKEGDFVRPGELLIRLDETVVQSNLKGVLKKIDELHARIARLQAERAAETRVRFPAILLARQDEPEVAEIIAEETKLFEARRESYRLRKERLSERVRQLKKEIEGLEAQQSARSKESAIAENELVGLRQLGEKKLVQMPRLNALERGAVNLIGQGGQLRSEIAQAHGRINETELQILNLHDDLRAEASKELREAQSELAQQHEKRIAAEDQLRRLDIRAPSSGYVLQLAMHTVGGVVTSAEPVMLIVPESEPLELEVKILPHDIDQIFIGQATTVRVLAFNRRTTPELKGEVRRVSADVTQDKENRLAYYSARIAIPEFELAKLGDVNLRAGMQAEAFLETGSRTPFEYLTRPLTDQVARAFKER